MLPISKEAELIKLHFENMLVQWGQNTPLRTGLHASSVLVSEAEWCVREHVLAALFPEQGVKPSVQAWDWKREAIFENGWDLHKRWQKLFMNFSHPVWNEALSGWELDLTHYDETRNLYFSPDAILDFAGQRYVVEIKGINHDEFVGHEAFYKRTFAKPGSAWTFDYEEVQEYRKGIKDCTLEEAMKASQTVNKAYYQANLYMHLLNIKKAILLIENKNNQDFCVWVIEHNQKLAWPYTDRMYSVKGSITIVKRDGLSRLPGRICKSRRDERARKCPMRDCCFGKDLEG